MRYVIKDRQFAHRYFAEGMTFKSKSDILEQLAEYHSIDFSDALEEDDNRDIWQYMNDNFKTTKEALNWILSYGQWEIEEYDKKAIY